MKLAEVFWGIFMATGSVYAYLIYKELMLIS